MSNVTGRQPWSVQQGKIQGNSNVFSYPLRSFLTACRKEVVLYLTAIVSIISNIMISSSSSSCSSSSSSSSSSRSSISSSSSSSISTSSSSSSSSSSRKEVKASCPLQLTGARRLGGATLANRLAASCNFNHSLPKGDPKRWVLRKIT